MQAHFTFVSKICILLFTVILTISSNAQTQFSADQLVELGQILGVQFTGNEVQDAAIYEQAKQDLQANNPQAYEQHFGRPHSINGFILIPGFTYTGNNSVDIINYKQAKIDLYNNNRPLYDQYFSVGQQSRIRMSQQEYSSLPSDKRTLVDSAGVILIDAQ